MARKVRDLMLAEAAYIVALEEHADLLGPAIRDCFENGDAAGAEALALLARRHRIRALEARGRLIVLAGQSRTPVVEARWTQR